MNAQANRSQRTARKSPRQTPRATPQRVDRRRSLTISIIAGAVGAALLSAAVAVIVLFGFESPQQPAIADGSAAVEISAPRTVEPGAGSPRIGTPRTVVPPAQWRMQPESDGALVLRSPDRGAELQLTALTQEAALAAFDEALDALLHGDGTASASASTSTSEDASGQSQAAPAVSVMRETLASGAELTHVRGGERFLAVVQVTAAQGSETEAVFIDATFASASEFDAYRFTLTGLVESIR